MNMLIPNSSNQIDFFAKTLTLTAVLSLIVLIYVFGSVFNAIYFLCFGVIGMITFITVHEILLKLSRKTIRPLKKAVLITGCDRGFGYGFAKRLSDVGFQVFAGCLYPFRNGALELNTHPRIHCFKMDVTKQEEVQLALDYVTNHLGCNELWAVINNAGISKGSDIETTSMQKIQEVLDVNLIGTICVIKTFLPLLRASKGRVINIASAAGRLTLPGFLPYSVSKNAIITFSDGFRLEMKRYGVHVISIEPWTYRTKLSSISGITGEIEKNCHSSKGDTTSTCKEDHVKYLKEISQKLFSLGMSDNLDEVINVMEEAVTLQYPAYRYAPGKWYLNIALWLLNFVPKPISDCVFCHFIFRR